ncbi:MAG: hypothetical protein GX774_08700 [Armatimonadetes bacterium]|nr:hypothetical protein [Armatimonadota bacterium]
MRPSLLAAIGLCFGTAPCLGAVTLDLGLATIRLDERGRVVSVRCGGREYAGPRPQPAFEVATERGVFRPVSVRRAGQELLVTFEGGGRMRLALTEGKGFAVLKVTDLAVPATVERLRLFSLPLKALETVAEPMNAAYDARAAFAVMSTEVNVRPLAQHGVSNSADLDGCTHRFEPITEGAREGHRAARFTATSRRDSNDGWSVVHQPLSVPLDLRGCQAIRAWVHGDGGGQHLKIQLADGQGGFRDDYIPIDFTGWRQVPLNQPALDTLRYDHVTQLSFYYNYLPAGRTVTCLLDQVEALVGEGDSPRVVLLEGFEDPNSTLWPFEGVRLAAQTEQRYGIEPAGVAVVACPRSSFIPSISRMERAAGLPSPRPGGAWSKRSPWVKRSYLFITSFAAADTDEVIAFARRGGFHMILIGQESWCASTGHYAIDTTNFPGGLETLRATVARLKQAGFKVGLHYLAPSIYPPDPYLTPVPDPRLVRDAFAELAADVDATADFIPTTTPPATFPAEDGGYMGQGAVIQIGNELIQYRERSMEPPYGFRGCTRGLHGTKATAHARGSRVAHLRKSYGYFLFDMDTDLIEEVADNLARVVNACDLDMIYWDGSEALQGEHWYYNAKLHKAFYDRFRNKDMLLQASSYSHYSWHIVSRMASADGHGDLKGYLDQRTPGFRWYNANLMPLDIGWYYVYNTSATTDQFEYVLNKSLGFNASISLQTNPASIRTHPYIGEIVDLIGAYERLRLGGEVPEATRARLRQPQRDYHLLQEEGEPVLQRVVYEPWRAVTTATGAEWEIEVKEGPARVGVELLVQPGYRLEPGPSYRSPQAVLLEGFDSLAPYLGDPASRIDVIGQTLPGVTQRFESVAEDAREGEKCAVYTATSTLSDESGWSCVGRQFDPPLDLSWHQGIGFWLRGDGGGGAFKLQLRDETGATDYYIRNDYQGWRYHQLARPEKDPIDYRRVRYLAFYYNGLPGKKSVTCAIDDVKALPALDAATVGQPTVAVADKRLTWNVSLSEGQALSYWPGQATRVTGPDVGQVEQLSSPEDLVLPAGRYRVRLTWGEGRGAAVTMRLTLQPPERLPVSARSKRR